MKTSVRKKSAVTGLVMLIALMGSGAQAQVIPSYTTALGVKAWSGGAGITYKNFRRSGRAVEGIAFFWDRGVRLTGLYEFHFDIDPMSVPGLKWYVGPGVHLGVYNQSYFDDRYLNGNGSGTYAGIDGVLGLDYKFADVPINLSLDWQPAYEFGDRRGFVAGWGGVGIRYTFSHF